MPDQPAPPPTDEQLLARFARGDRSSLGELASRHENALIGLATGLLNGRRDLAQDAVQEAWIRVIKYTHSFRAQSSVKTWLYRIVINKCRDLRDAAARGSASTPSPEPSLRLVTVEGLDEDVRAALDRLVPSTRLILLLCYHRGLTHPQAAEVLDIPVGTLKSRLSAALKELRAEMNAAPSAQPAKAAQP